MSKIELKRYTPGLTDHRVCMAEYEAGKYVLASDATAAIEKLDRSMRESWDSEKRLAASLTAALERIAVLEVALRGIIVEADTISGTASWDIARIARYVLSDAGSPQFIKHSEGSQS